jgi:hypothetical protein
MEMTTLFYFAGVISGMIALRLIQMGHVKSVPKRRYAPMTDREYFS